MSGLLAEQARVDVRGFRVAALFGQNDPEVVERFRMVGTAEERSAQKAFRKPVAPGRGADMGESRPEFGARGIQRQTVFRGFGRLV